MRGADAVWSNLRGDVPAKIKIRYDDLKELNPRIVCCSLTGFGMTGPRRQEPGYDYILQGLAGWMEVTGEPDGPPTKSGLSMVDYSGGFIAAISLLSGIHAARRDGVGMDCDVSLYDTAIAMLNYPGTWALNTDFVPSRPRHSAHPSLVPFQAFRTKDSWIIVGCPKEKFWRRLAPVVGRPEWAEDPRYATFAARGENKDTLLPALEQIFATRTSEQWLAELYPAGIPCGPINTVRESFEEEHTRARELIVTTEHPRWGPVRQPRTAVSVGPVRTDFRRAPQRNEDFGHVVRELLVLRRRPDRGPGGLRRVRRRRHDAVPAEGVSPMSAPTLAEQLAAWAVGLSYDDVPEAVLAAARRHLLDGLGTALAAARAGVVGAAVQVATGLGGPPEARILGTGSTVSAPAAALANGALVHGLDFDDTHAGGLCTRRQRCCRPRSPSASRSGRTGASCSTAAVVGLRGGLPGRRGRSPHGFHARGLHATQVAGTLAAAAVAARLLGLDAAHDDQRARHRGLVVRRAAGVPVHRCLDQGAAPRIGWHERDPGSAARGGRGHGPDHGAGGPARDLRGAVRAPGRPATSVVEGLGSDGRRRGSRSSRTRRAS